MASYLPYAPFTGTAPPVPQTAKFAAPDPTTLSPYGQFRLSQGTKAIERGAAARGTLLTGGLQTRLAEFGQGLASEEAGNDYERAMRTYTVNRDTDQQNYGREQTGFNNALSLFDMNRETAEPMGSSLAAPAPSPVPSIWSTQQPSAPLSAPPASALNVDPNAERNAMLERQQAAANQDRIAEERRAQGLLTDENAALEQRQLSGNQANAADEARANAARMQPAPAATGYQDMLAQYAEFQRQIAEQERMQRAGSDRQNVASAVPLDLAQADARRRMLVDEQRRLVGTGGGRVRG